HLEATVARIEEAHHDFFAAHRRENGDAQLDSAQFRPGRGMALLGQTGLITDQAGHHFETAGDFLHQFQRQMDQLRQHPAEPDAHFANDDIVTVPTCSRFSKTWPAQSDSLPGASSGASGMKSTSGSTGVSTK